MMTPDQIKAMREEILAEMWKCPCVGNCPRCVRGTHEIAVIDRIMG